MTISSVTYTAHNPIQVKSSEAAEGPGPDHDGDSDDAGVAAAPAKAPQVGDKNSTGVYI